MAHIQPQIERPSEAIEILRPARQTVPLVFASPHSGADYPDSFIAASRLDLPTLRRSEDAFVDELYLTAPAHGAPLLRALFPRAFIDPNREAFELDPTMFSDPLPAFVNIESARVSAGLGTIAKLVTSGQNIYRGKLTFSEAAERINRFYRPYHKALQGLIAQTRALFGHCVLIDCHSMPSIGGPMDPDAQRARVDFVLGDCFGASCDPRIIDRVEQVLKGFGRVVHRNRPYAGGFTTVNYGRPSQGVHTLQIEINRALYMDELQIERTEGIAPLSAELEQVIIALGALGELPIAAE